MKKVFVCLVAVAFLAALVVRNYIEEVVNTGNVDRIAEFISPEYVEVYRGTR